MDTKQTNRINEFLKKHNNKTRCKHCGEPISYDGSPFKSLACYAYGSNKPKVYCSKKCLSADLFQKGKNHASYKNGSGRGHIARLSKKIRGSKCTSCGTSNRLVVHHIDNNPRNYNEDNLTTLCHSCHRRHHWEVRSPKSTRLSPQEWYTDRKVKTKKKRESLISQKMLDTFGTEKSFTIKDISVSSGLSKQRVNVLVLSGRIESIKFGGRHFCPSLKIKKFARQKSYISKIAEEKNVTYGAVKYWISKGLDPNKTTPQPNKRR